MIILKTIAELREYLAKHRARDEVIGLVPTMGYLHEGHLSLVKEARNDGCDCIVMSIFVNPLQFGPSEDFERYPRNLARDQELAEAAGVDVLFVPSTAEMYPQPCRTTVSVTGLTNNLCGKSRPGHFDGVATVVSKLFHIVQPDKAFFGSKDYQQVQVIRTLTEDLNLPVTVVACPIVREPDGLALSSRNVYLNADERQQALALSKALKAASELVQHGETNPNTILSVANRIIDQQPLARVDYISLVDAQTLQDVEVVNRPVVLALAVYFGKTRLIDNAVMIPQTGTEVIHHV